MNRNNFEAVWLRVKKITKWKRQNDLAEFLGITPGSVSGAKQEGVFREIWAKKIAQEFNCDISDILSPEAEPSPRQIHIPEGSVPDPEDFEYVPMAKAQLSAGNGAFVLSEEMQGYYAFRKEWLSRAVSSAKNAVLVHVTGNSMAPTIIENDVVMLDTGRRHVYDGKIYALRMDSTVMVKRLALRPADRILIMSDNKEEYEPYEADRKDIQVLGQIVWFARTLVKID
jgi:phage repressor protein C with HTH and peptisase S24 domain